MIECKSICFGKHNQYEWVYKRHFDCNSKKVIYIVICNYYWEFFIGETGDLKERIRLHKSNTLHPHNANCKKLSNHLHKCSRSREPYFQIYPIYYVEDQQHRRFVEKRFIHKFKRSLNSDS